MAIVHVINRSQSVRYDFMTFPAKLGDAELQGLTGVHGLDQVFIKKRTSKMQAGALESGKVEANWTAHAQQRNRALWGVKRSKKQMEREQTHIGLRD